VTGPGDKSILQVHELARHFPVRGGIAGGATGQVVKAVDGVSFSLSRGEVLAIVGESGSGKTTLGRLLMRLIDATSGRIVFDGEDITASNARALRPVRRRMQMIFQDPFSSLDPRMSVRQLLLEPLEIHDVPRSEREARVRDVLATVGLRPEHADRHPHQFSGGQRQRIGIARALIMRPEVIVGDEPVSALDVSVRAQILNLLSEIRLSLGLSLIIITHDLGVVRHVADRVLVLYLGRVVEIGTTRDILDRPRHPYTRALISATLDPFAAKRTREVLSGEAPSPIAPPSGCHFHPRCPMVREICRSQPPPLVDAGDGHVSACHFADAVATQGLQAQDETAPSAYLRRLAILQQGARPKSTLSEGVI